MNENIVSQGDESFNGQRLRRLVNLLGLSSAVPESDSELLACLGSVLGMACRRIEGLESKQAKATREGYALMPIEPTHEIISAMEAENKAVRDKLEKELAKNAAIAKVLAEYDSTDIFTAQSFVKIRAIFEGEKK